MRSEILRDYNLVLTEQEAAWLHAVMQNPLYGIPESETTLDKEMRRGFFEATAGTKPGSLPLGASCNVLKGDTDG